MRFDESRIAQQIGKGTGFVVSYAFFAALLYLVLQWTGNLPEGWRYSHIFLIALTIILLGLFVRMVLR